MTARLSTVDDFRAALVRPADVPRSRTPLLITGERADVEELCGHAALPVLDTVDAQLRELAEVRLPGGSADERRSFADSLASDGYGTWVYYPWLAQVVRVLPEDDFLAVITDRNRQKITREEQRRLRTRTVGVLGLSVGAEAAFALAQEHLCGRLVIADFDRLELSNLNRLAGGVGDLGLPKTTLLARRIALLDPYLEVDVRDAALTESTMDGFLSGLDLLVEECDGLDVKFAVREWAGKHGLDIVYAADERGFLSVEPYGQDPSLVPFHGLVTEPPKPRESYASKAEFLTALTAWLGGMGAISRRSRASLAGVGTEVSGYPQLAGEARLAAGQIAHVARRLLLGERLAPGTFHVDLDALIPTRPS